VADLAVDGFRDDLEAVACGALPERPRDCADGEPGRWAFFAERSACIFAWCFCAFLFEAKAFTCLAPFSSVQRA
jgi:hypothetical protein